MEFWGVEVKPGQTYKCDIDEGKMLHLSQAALGESKNKAAENVPIFVKFNDQKLVLGTLSLEKCAQIQYDLVFEKEFELSHGSKNASVCFMGYMTTVQDDYPSGEDDFDSDSEEDEQIAANTNANGKVKAKEQEKPSAGKTNPKKEETVKAEKPKSDDDDDSEDDSDDDDDDSEDGEDDSEDESDNDEDILEPTGDSDDEDEDDSDDEDEDEATPKKAAISGKKRPAESASKTPVPEKKAKVVTPVGQKTGGNGKKVAHTATPHPAKQAGKTPASGDKLKQQTPKSAGSAACKECNKSFNSDNALQAHNKAKHSAK